MSAVPQKVNMGFQAGRMLCLRRAADMVGLKHLADGLGITTRNLRQKFDAERGLDDATLNAAASVLERRAAELIERAGKLRCAAKGEQS